MSVMSDRVAQVADLRAQGLSLREAAERLGISYSYAKHLNAPSAMSSSQLASRDAKRRRRGVCSSCGAATRYAGYRGKPVSDRCQRCANREIGLAARGSRGVTAAALEFLSVPRRACELRDHLGVSSNYVSATLYQRLLPYGLVRRVSRGVYVAVPRQDS